MTISRLRRASACVLVLAVMGSTGPLAHARAPAPAEDDAEPPTEPAESIDDEQDEAAAPDEPTPADETPTEPTPDEAPPEVTPAPEPVAAPPEGPQRFEKRRRERAPEDKLLLRGGIVATSLGVAAAIPMAVGLASGAEIESRLADYDASPETNRADQEETRTDLLRQGRTMNRLALGTGIVAGVYLTGGIVLLALALRGSRERERRASIAPTIGREHAGFLLQGRF